MTRYLLYGGNDRAYEGFASSVLHEIYRANVQPVVLSCMFSVADDKAEEKFISWKQWWQVKGADFRNYTLANKIDFLDQLERADVVFLHGGDNDLLIDSLYKYQNIEDHFKGKLIIGSSAGANFLARAFYSRSYGGWRPGSGIVPYNILVHYGVSEQDNPINWSTSEAAIAEFNGSNPKDIVRIHEGDYFVYENY